MSGAVDRLPDYADGARVLNEKPRTFARFSETMRCGRALRLGEQAVYVLVDPRDETIRYVGKTKDPVARSVAHARQYAPHNPRVRAWSQELRAAGLAPRLEVVDVDPDARHSSSVEEALVCRLRQSGAALYNRSYNGATAVMRELTSAYRKNRNPAEPSNKSKAQTERWKRIREAEQ